MQNKDELWEALHALGELLESRGLQFDLAVIGGGVLLMRGMIVRPTLDLDVVATIISHRWHKSQPLPEALVRAIRQVGEVLDLPWKPRDEKDWLNAGPSFLFEQGLPEGFEDRVEFHRFGSLTIRMAARVDLITLKLWAATDTARGDRRRIDIADLKKLAPRDDELAKAVDWCARKDGRTDFIEQEVQPVLQQLAVNNPVLS